MKKRISYEERSVLAYAARGESYSEAEARLAKLWELGTHPAQTTEAERQARRRAQLLERREAK